jgi:hypothetical protein
VASQSSRCQARGRRGRFGVVVWMEWRAYRTREPSPYWPLKGKAHTTCKAVAVAVALAAGVGPSRPRSVATSAVEIEGSAGIVEQLCARIGARCWSARVIYLRLPGIRVAELLRMIERARRLRKKKDVPWPSWGKFVDRLSAAASSSSSTVRL